MSDPIHTTSFTEVLRSRRMCRDFTDEPVDTTVLDGILDAARRAPSAGNTAALDLVVLQGSASVARYWDVTLSEQRRARFAWPGLLHAPVLVLPYVSPTAYVERYAELDKAHSGLGAGTEAWSVPYWWVDGGAAVMAVLLAAEEAELGALFFGQFGHELAVARRLSVPADRRCLGTIAVGHARPGGHSRSRSVERTRPGSDAVIHRDRW